MYDGALTACVDRVDTDAKPCKHRVNHKGGWFPHNRYWGMAGSRHGHVQRCEPVTCPLIKLTGIRLDASVLTTKATM